MTVQQIQQINNPKHQTHLYYIRKSDIFWLESSPLKSFKRLKQTSKHDLQNPTLYPVSDIVGTDGASEILIPFCWANAFAHSVLLHTVYFRENILQKKIICN